LYASPFQPSQTPFTFSTDQEGILISSPGPNELPSLQATITTHPPGLLADAPWRHRREKDFTHTGF
jgi:hypothetical protein